jgi:hypothetical protein
VEYDYSELDELVLAYAVSVHKSQGSEYPCVVIPLLTQHYILLQRHLLYTAITRGKRLVIVVGSKKSFGHRCEERQDPEAVYVVEESVGEMNSQLRACLTISRSALVQKPTNISQKLFDPKRLSDKTLRAHLNGFFH